ncbi:MAG: oxidoreductase [Cyanobacteria bacterium SW_8_48_13]|nr:MAG: oxidoreductase [Cyanobacteria bacterium QS_9_48_30]PSP21389.1 MAG: oxidoreductase [Cyanobacteria bacterium SW_8_48_13]
MNSTSPTTSSHKRTATEKPTVGVAVVGTGFGQKIHLPGFQHHPRTQPVAVYNHDLDKAKAIANDNQIPHAGSELEEILSLPEVDAVSIATPPFQHYEMAKAVLEAGKHLLLEKPMTLTASQTRELHHLAAEKGVAATADFEFRFVPSWQLLAEYLAQEYVGQIRLVKIDWLTPSRANPERAWNWYAQKKLGGGALGAVGSHSFDYLNWLFGGVRRLSAQLRSMVSPRPDPAAGGEFKPVDSDDTALLILELAGGTPAQLALSSVTYQGRGHWMEIYGDRGTLVLGNSNLKDYVHGFCFYAAPAGKPLAEVEIPKRLAFSEVFSDGRLAPFIRVVDHWVQAIDAGRSMIPSLREGTYSQLLMDLTHQSSQSNCWVDVPELDNFLASE